MNEEVIKTLNQQEKIRNAHPYWIYESINMIPEILEQCLNSNFKKYIDRVVLCPENCEKTPYADIEIRIPNQIQIPEFLSPIIYMIPMWQMAYQFSLLGRGSHPDRLSMDKPEFKAAFNFLMEK